MKERSPAAAATRRWGERMSFRQAPLFETVNHGEEEKVTLTVRNKANSKRSFKFEVSSVKQEKPMADSSSLPTSNFTLKTFGGTPAAPWTFVRNKPNFPPSGSNDEYFMGKGL